MLEVVFALTGIYLKWIVSYHQASCSQVHVVFVVWLLEQRVFKLAWCFGVILWHCCKSVSVCN